MQDDIEKILSTYDRVIIVDTRESDIGLNVDCTIRMALDVFDYVIKSDKLYLIERKDAKDFISSIKDGRLISLIQHKISLNENELKNAVIILAVIGDVIKAALEHNYYGGRFPISSIFGFYVALVSVGIPVIVFQNNAEFLLFLSYLYERKPRKFRFPVRIIQRKRLLTSSEKKIAALEVVLGTKTAYNVLNKYGSIINIIRTLINNENDLLSVEGIGKKKLAELKELLLGKFDKNDIRNIKIN